MKIEESWSSDTRAEGNISALFTFQSLIDHMELSKTATGWRQGHMWKDGAQRALWPSLEKLWVRWMEATGVIRATEHRMVMRPFPSAAGSDRQKPSGCLYSSLPGPGQRRGGHLAAIDFPSPMQRFWRSMQHEGICVLIKAVCSADQCRLKPGSVWPTIGQLREASGPVRRT